MENNKEQKTVVVGMSGGVDSSVAAALLLEQGYKVIGAFMKNWSDTKDPKTGECAWKEERRDAMRVAADLGIPFETFDFEEAYRKNVVDYLYKEYEAGRTPNPDVLCNSQIKFDLFLKKALELGADYVATGHYARVQKDEGGYHLLAGDDRKKDQSYFIFRLGQDELKHILFPLGDLTKEDVRAYAHANNIETAGKKDSQGICFIGKVDMKEFLAKTVKGKPGDIVTVEGEKIGEHDGIAPYTIGQRHGLGIGGGTPYFVVEKNMKENTLIVAKGTNHPALYKETLIADDLTWVSGREPELPLTCKARIRYRQPLQGCTVKPGPEGGTIEVRFDQEQRAISPGQFIVLHDGDEVLGGGVIQ